MIVYFTQNVPNDNLLLCGKCYDFYVLDYLVFIRDITETLQWMKCLLYVYDCFTIAEAWK